MGNRCSKRCFAHISNCGDNATPKAAPPQDLGSYCKACAIHHLQVLRDSSFRAGFELGLRHQNRKVSVSDVQEGSADKVKEDFKWVVQYPPPELEENSANHISLP